jgi:hypothetical protein
MKKLIIIIILMMLLLPTSYVFAEDKETGNLPEYNTLMLFKGNLPLVDKYDYVFINEKMTKGNEMSDCLNCIEEKKQFSRIGIGGKITNPLNEYENKKIKTSHFSWIIIPNIEESQPSGIIQLTYSY